MDGDYVGYDDFLDELRRALSEDPVISADVLAGFAELTDADVRAENEAALDQSVQRARFGELHRDVFSGS